MTGSSGSVGLLIAVLASVHLFSLSVACPPQCECSPEETAVRTRMTCKRGPMTSVPQDVQYSQIIIIDGKGRNDINITYITETSFAKFTKLEELTIAHSNIRFVHRRAFSTLTKLLRLDLHNNLIEYLDEKIFSSMRFLVYLDLSNNKIRRVYRDMFAFPSLRVLSLKDNRADLRDRRMFQNLTFVDVLDISGNDVGSELPAAFLGVSPNLRVLRMNSCGLKEVGAEFFDFIKNANIVELRNNYISEISPGSLSHLKYLRELQLDNNNLHTLDTAVFQNLELRILGLGRNNISVLREDTFHNTSIGHIVLSNNSISYIPPGIFTPISGVLTKIQLDGNPLGYIGPDTFIGMSELDFIDLSNTQLANFSPQTFEGVAIKFLDLSKNLLKIIDKNSFQQFEQIELIDLSANPWHCTCFIKPLKKWLLESNYSQDCTIEIDPKAKLTDKEKRPFTNCLICSSPKVNANLSVINLTAGHLAQCYYDESGGLTLDQQVLIAVSVSICVVLIAFIGYSLYGRRNVLKYTLKGRQDIISNPNVSMSSIRSRTVSKADLTDEVATEPAKTAPNVKLENISVISQPGFDAEAEKKVNGIVYKNRFSPEVSKLSPEVDKIPPEVDKIPPEVNGNDIASLESCV